MPRADPTPAVVDMPVHVDATKEKPGSEDTTSDKGKDGGEGGEKDEPKGSMKDYLASRPHHLIAVWLTDHPADIRLCGPPQPTPLRRRHLRLRRSRCRPAAHDPHLRQLRLDLQQSIDRLGGRPWRLHLQSLAPSPVLCLPVRRPLRLGLCLHARDLHRRGADHESDPQALLGCDLAAGSLLLRQSRDGQRGHAVDYQYPLLPSTSNPTLTTPRPDCNRVNQGIAEKLYTLFQGFSLFFSAYIVALAVQWKLALIVMSIIPAIFFTIGAIIAVIAPLETKVTRIYSRAAVLAQDALSSIKTIHAFGAASKMLANYDEYLTEAHEKSKIMSLMFGIIFSTQTFFVLSGTSLAFWQGLRMFRNGEIGSVGTVFTVILSVTLGATSVMLIAPQIQALTNAASSASELFLTIDKPSEIDPLSDEGIRPEECEGDIVIRNLRFTYPTRPTALVLDDLDLKVPAGKTTALVGPSGCGKSTLVGLLERWYLPQSGEILLDGRDVKEYNTHWLRSRIRLVQQEPILFQGTVFENVAKGLVGEQKTLSEEKKMELVKEACISANAHEFIEQLPGGYHCQVGERASMLSGGQRQRVSIARSIISNPKVLLLDEATSALDPRAEAIVQNALNKVSKNKTTLVIAHKLATIKAADNIAVMKDGRLIEQGTHAELLERQGLYAAMVRAQDLGHADADPNASKEEIEEPNSERRSEEEDDAGLGRPLTLQRTKSSAPSTSSGKGKKKDKEVDPLARGTLDYSLIRSMAIMLPEHPDLWPWYLATVLGSLIGGGTYPAQAIIFSKLIHVFTLTGQEQATQRNFWALMFFVLAIANLIGYFAVGWACNTIGQAITHRYRKEMMERMLNFDQDFFDRPENSSGALTSNLSSVPTSLMELISANLGLMLNVLVNIVASSALGIAYGWKLGLVLVFGGMTILVAAGYVRIRLDQKLEEMTDKRFASSAGLVTEAVTAIRTVSMLTLEPVILDEYNEALSDVLRKTTKNLCLTLIPYALSQSVDFLVLALGFWYGSQLIAKGEYTTEQFFVVFIAVVFGGQGVAQFFGYTTSITKATGAANYILWLRTVHPTIQETDENRDVGPVGEGAIEMKDVEFRYRQRHASRVLRGISMNIPHGTHAAFVGPSGCGKSTLVSLLERFYDPTSGSITLDGHDIRSYSPHKYRRYMSLVQQEPPLYLGSVRDNIAIGLEHPPTDAEVQDACRQANAQAFIASLPEGLATPCGSKGLQFSGGQRQRIAVARALVRKPTLLLLDEATSALDTQSERIVQRALDEAGSGRTTIAVAHRLSTIKGADCIYVIEDGRIAERGTHEELQRKRGRYYAMCLAQSLDQADTEV